MPRNREQFTIHGLESDRLYYFALKTVDDGDNLSGLSNVVSAITVGDTIPPAGITDLEVAHAAGRSVHFRWTAPGDNGSTGQAAEYDLRHSSSLIDEVTWASATRVSGLVQPAPAGEIETYTVADLQLDTEYYFALRATDRAGNVSGISNVALATTSSLVILTSSPAGRSASSPDWEPNGDRIAFSARWSGTVQVHTVNARDGSLTQITSVEDNITTPAWSPDGSVLACGLIRFEDSRQGIGIVSGQPGSILTPIVIHESERIVSNPAWSPDGDRIAYQVAEFPSFVGEIFVVDLAGSAPQSIVPGGSSISGLDWSPDGSFLVCSSNIAGSYDLWTVSIDGGMPTRLTSDDSTNETEPVWSPDGSKIAFVLSAAGERDLWIVPASGGPPAQVTFGSVWKRSPCWSPTGDALACEILQDGRTGDIAIVYLP
jgi:Tol biopolymer transport system component